MRAFAGCGFENLCYGRPITFVSPGADQYVWNCRRVAKLGTNDVSLVVMSSSYCLF